MRIETDYGNMSGICGKVVDNRLSPSPKGGSEKGHPNKQTLKNQACPSLTQTTTRLGFGIPFRTPPRVQCNNYEYTALAEKTSVSREARLLFVEPQ